MDFAYLEAKLILAMLLQKFTLKLVSPPEDHRESDGLTMSIANGLNVSVQIQSIV
jgi:cytochrome P450